jgi:hypothetical protein
VLHHLARKGDLAMAAEPIAYDQILEEPTYFAADSASVSALINARVLVADPTVGRPYPLLTRQKRSPPGTMLRAVSAQVRAA